MTQVPSFAIIVDLSTPTGLWTWFSKIDHFQKSADLFAIHLDALNVWTLAGKLGRCSLPHLRTPEI